jgi:hypothetical protein
MDFRADVYKSNITWIGVTMCVTVILAGAGCGNSSQAAQPAGAVSGTQQALNAPNASSEMKQQAPQQQQIGDAQNAALRAAAEREQGSGTAAGH